MFQGRRIERVENGQELRGNSKSWLLTIATHKKPYDEREWDLLRESLARAIYRILEDEDFRKKIVFRFVPGRGAAKDGNQPFFDEAMRTDDNLQIISEDVKFCVERGEKQNRIDAHILYTVTHGRMKLQIDHLRLAELVDAELEIENKMFVDMSIKSSRRNQPLAWCKPSVYTSFRHIGDLRLLDAELYIRKNLESGKRRNLYSSEADLLRTLVTAPVFPGVGKRILEMM